ncbi:MAG: YlbF family regulator [Oscillospiraceae bacterium]|nr:YlbF family regulator [Oscillospiraceae bacterium]
MDIIAMARELGKEIQKDERYQRYVAAREANDNDQTLQDLIEKFNLKRVELSSAINSEDRDVDKLTQLDKELKDLYQDIMNNDNMLAFNAAKAELDDVVSFVNQIVMGSVNGENPDLIEKQVGCGGNCASCGGCH